MIGGIILVIIMLAVMPVAVMLGGAVWSALIGQLETEDAARRPEA